jgi:uncharacterized pyridoxal phosphate-containing UPF0001 family protein
VDQEYSFLIQTNDETGTIRQDSLSKISAFLNTSSNAINNKIDLVKKIQGKKYKNHLHLTPLNRISFNIFGEKYFSDLFDKAKKLISAEMGHKMNHVGLSLILQLAQINSKSILNKLCGQKLQEYFRGKYH